MDARTPPPPTFRAKLKQHSAQAFARVRRAPWKRIALWVGGLVGGLIVAVALLLTFLDWNSLKGPVSRFASRASGRDVVIAGDLHVNPWSLTPKISVTQLHIGNPPRYRDRGEFASVQDGRIAIRIIPLIFGKIDIAQLDLRGANVALYRNADGVSNWSSENGAKQMNMPAIQRFSLNGGHLSLRDDKRNMTLNGDFASQEGMAAARGQNAQPFELTGTGQINARPFKLTFSGGALINVRRDRPYGFVADVTAGATRIVANGQVTRPFDLNYFNADIRATGNDLADLYYLLGLTLPNTPPYDLTGHVAREGPRYEMTEMTGRVGDSDLAGQFSVAQQSDHRPFFDGDFHSRSLDFDDLMTLLGGAPSIARGETASPEQRAEAAQLQAENRILPDAKLDIHRVRNMDARISFDADHVRTDKLPLRGMNVDVTLDHGLLRLSPLTLELVNGHVVANASINARETTPQVALDARLSGARIQNFFMTSTSNSPLDGSLAARVQLHGPGRSVREVAANASGTMAAVVPHGEVRESLAELTGINVTRGLGLLLTHDESKIDVRCGVAHFNVSNGIATADNVILDTDTMLIHGGGHVSLKDETFDLNVRGTPKEIRLVRVAAPIAVRGRLRDPHVSINIGRVGAQAGLAAILSTVVGPVAAVLPFVDAGLADDADCAQLLASVGVPRRQANG